MTANTDQSPEGDETEETEPLLLNLQLVLEHIIFRVNNLDPRTRRHNMNKRCGHEEEDEA